MVRQVRQGVDQQGAVEYVTKRLGAIRYGRRSTARRCRQRIGLAEHGRDWHGRNGWSRQGPAECGVA